LTAARRAVGAERRRRGGLVLSIAMKRLNPTTERSSSSATLAIGLVGARSSSTVATRWDDN
jgi:hypothetical protein